MQVVVSARHFDVSDQLRRVVETRVAKLARYEPRVARAEVALVEEKNRCEVEARVSVDGQGIVHARGEAPDFRTAVDLAVDRLERQLKRTHARRRDHQAVPRSERIPEEESGP